MSNDGQGDLFGGPAASSSSPPAPGPVYVRAYVRKPASPKPERVKRDKWDEMSPPEVEDMLERIETGGAHADAVRKAWREDAAEAIREYARQVGRAFLVEEIQRDYAEQPPDRRAWGAAVQRARKLGYIEPAGVARASCGGLYTTWRHVAK